MNILIVDDDTVVLEALKANVVRAGHHVLTARDGRQALTSLKASKRDILSIDAMVTDLKMPGMDGLELIRWVKKEMPDLPVILMTGYGDDSIRWKTLGFKFCGYFEKPFRPESLVTKIEDLWIQQVAS